MENRPPVPSITVNLSTNMRKEDGSESLYDVWEHQLIKYRCVSSVRKFSRTERHGNALCKESR